MVMEMEQDVTEEAPPLEMDMDVGGETDPVMEEESVVEEENTPEFNGPIPGASLTGELGAEAHEKPPTIVDPEEAYDDLADRIESPEAFKRIVIAAKMDMPIELVARSIVFSGWATGHYTQDVMMLIYGPIFDLMMALLDKEGIDYVPLAKRSEDSRLKEAMDELEDYENTLEGEEEIPLEEGPTEEIEMVEEESFEDEVDAPTTGLMGMRRE